MNHKKILILAVIALFFIAYFSGVLPGLSLLDNGLDTKKWDRWGAYGNPNMELLDAKGYALSYMNDEHSQKIIVSGSIKHKLWSMAEVDKYWYVVSLKEDVWGSYEVVSKPGEGETSKHISADNPGKISTGQFFDGEGGGDIFTCTSYQFTIVGPNYANGAIKVELWGDIDPNIINPFDKWEKKVLASDEAFLYSGYGGLYLPRGIEDGVERPYSTFEIGQEVDITVETAKGGSDSGKPWRVTLNEPYSGDIEKPGDGGGVVETQDYPNDATSHFKFTVTSDMAKKSMESDDPYTLRIWNSLVPKGTLNVDFVDFIALCPGEVEFSGDGIQSKVGEVYTLSLNSKSDIGIDCFRIEVIYGNSEVLLPSDQSSKLWIIHTTNVGEKDKTLCILPQTISFKPETESFVTVHAKAIDIEGRASKITKYYTIWAYAENEAPDETIEKETGEGDYGGGHTSGWMPWDPEGGNWNDNQEPVNYIPLIIGILVFIASVLIALKTSFPKKYGPYGMIGCIVGGAVIAVLLAIGVIPLGL